MDVARFIQSLEARGLRLASESVHIVPRDPKGELRSEIVALVAAHKAELLTYLQQHVAPAALQADALTRLCRLGVIEHLHRASVRLRDRLARLFRRHLPGAHPRDGLDPKLWPSRSSCAARAKPGNRSTPLRSLPKRRLTNTSGSGSAATCAVRCKQCCAGSGSGAGNQSRTLVRVLVRLGQPARKLGLEEEPMTKVELEQLLEQVEGKRQTNCILEGWQVLR